MLIKRKKSTVFSELPYRRQKLIISVAFLLLPLVFLLVFTYLPAVIMFNYSFTSWNGTSVVKDYVGLKNYAKIFSDLSYFAPLKVSLYYLVASIIQILLALVIATILSFKVKFTNLFKGIYFFPSLINSVAIGFIFLFYFQPNGTLDTVLKIFGLEGFIGYWLRDPKNINVSLAYASVWRYIGFNIVMFSAAISSISEDIFEASAIDGANKFHQFIYIIIPSIMTILGLNLFLSISGALTAFEIPYIMTGGGNGSETFIIQMINTAFKNKNIGLASALAIVLLIIIMVITIIQRIIFSQGGGKKHVK